jgi:hypothetical protein
MYSRPFAGEVAARVNSVGFAMSEIPPHADNCRAAKERSRPGAASSCEAAAGIRVDGPADSA